VGCPTRLWWPPVATDIGDDHGPVGTHRQLGSVTFTYPRALFKAEGFGQERHRRSHIWVDHDRHNGRRRY
jgi:hypothetical protein